MREQRRAKSSPRGHDLAKAIDYILKPCCAAFTLFLDDGRACLSNNAAERALRGASLSGANPWLFCGSGSRRSACCRNV